MCLMMATDEVANAHGNQLALSVMLLRIKFALKAYSNRLGISHWPFGQT